MSILEHNTVLKFKSREQFQAVNVAMKQPASYQYIPFTTSMTVIEMPLIRHTS